MITLSDDTDSVWTDKILRRTRDETWEATKHQARNTVYEQVLIPVREQVSDQILERIKIHMYEPST